jgi:dynein intermediate chain 3, axonemal
MKHIAMSHIEKSHKAYVADLAFVPGTVKVDKKNDNKFLSEHFVTVSEDGFVSIWDTRHVRLEEIKAMEATGKIKPWAPYLNIQLFRPDGDPNLGLSRILFQPNQTTTTFWAGSFEGEFLMVDWAVRPAAKADAEGGEGGEKARADNVVAYFDCERSWRPILAVERSPFYDDLVLTVHDFYFCIWKTGLAREENFYTPIFKSANSFGSHNTCGGFSPTRPGVIFITRTDAIDVWDFQDQAHRPSITLPLATSSITYFKFQHQRKDKNQMKNTRTTQHMCYGELQTGNLNLCEVPSNLSKASEKEKDIIKTFWETEFKKCKYVKERKGQIQAELEVKAKNEAKRKAEEEKLKSVDEETIANEMEADNEKYLDLLLLTKAKFNKITQEEYDTIMKAKKKK